jgi:hypothetical protein
MLESVIATSEFHLPKKILSSVFPAPYSIVAPKTPWKILLLLLTVGDFHPLADQSFGAQVRCRINADGARLLQSGSGSKLPFVDAILEANATTLGGTLRIASDRFSPNKTFLFVSSGYYKPSPPARPWHSDRYRRGLKRVVYSEAFADCFLVKFRRLAVDIQLAQVAFERRRPIFSDTYQLG